MPHAGSRLLLRATPGQPSLLPYPSIHPLLLSEREPRPDIIIASALVLFHVKKRGSWLKLLKGDGVEGASSSEDSGVTKGEKERLTQSPWPCLVPARALVSDS